MKLLKRIECPCCGYYSIEDWGEEVIVDICPICFWQYDIVGQEKPDIAIGPNHVSLNQARENYRNFGAKEERVIDYVRKPLAEELPDNNGKD